MTYRNLQTAFLRQLPENDRPQPPRHNLIDGVAVRLGRDPRCEIVIDAVRYRAVSRQHAAVRPIVQEGDSQSGRLVSRWQLCDLDSSNGTFVNGERVYGCRVLQPGDRIMLGLDGPEFLFDLDPVAEPSSPGTEPVKARQSSPDYSNLHLPSLPARSSPRVPVPDVTARASYHPPESERISLTQLFPIVSTGRELTRKAHLLPGAITVTFVVLLFLSVGRPIVFNLLLAGYLTGAAYYFIYRLCGKQKPWWLLVGTAAATVLLILSPVLDGFLLVFRKILPGAIPADPNSVSFGVLLIKMFFGTGLMEELFKVLPLLAIWLIGRRLRMPWRDRCGIREPLDGILLGAASAVGFTLTETLGQYMPDIYQATLKAGEDAAQLASLQLLIPRILGLVAGHMAYSGYLGYFIGLSILRPRKRWLVLSVGYLTAAGLHALWNTMGMLSPVLLALVGLISYAFLAAAILKARELSPTRSQNFATRFHK